MQQKAFYLGNVSLERGFASDDATAAPQPAQAVLL